MSLDFIVLNLAHRHTLLFLGRTGHALHKSSSHSIEADVPNYCSTASGSQALQIFVNDFTFPHPPLLSSPIVSTAGALLAPPWPHVVSAVLYVHHYPVAISMRATVMVQQSAASLVYSIAFLAFSHSEN